ncbi:MAG: LysR family transcriptional regulator [Ilumatobacter sp.]|jgi:DNA-binding transcriptional LysR family regulator|uniref:LysR family transcriptional regulator n=1 Tax=Ilumatobacter sp. TaxID=1967498 RepID=UPI00391A2242
MPLPADVPDLSALDLLRSVVELGSVSKAADAHRITQPSASSRIRTLERQLGLTVLDRSPTGSVPTPEGQMVAGWGADVLRAAERLASGVASLKAELSGLLRIAASYTIAEYVLPPWLDEFLEDRPGDSVTLDVTNSRAVIERLDAGAVDLGFVESPTVPTTMDQLVVGNDELIPVVSPRHRWAPRGAVGLDEFAHTPLVLREQGSGTREALERELRRLGCDAPTSALDLGSISAVRIAVINGASPTVISRLAVADDLAAHRLVEIDVPGLTIQRELRAIWLRRATLPRLATTLLDAIAHHDLRGA